VPGAAAAASRLCRQLSPAVARPFRRAGDRGALRGLPCGDGAARAQVARLRGALEARGREVTELAHMLAAWEALRVGKDAQARALRRVGVKTLGMRACPTLGPARLPRPVPHAGPCPACRRALGAGAALRHACLCLSQARAAWPAFQACSLPAGAMS